MGGWGPFARAFKPSRGLRVPPYLALLGLTDDAPTAIDIVARLAGKRGAPESFGALLTDPNWRPHVIAAVAARVHRYPDDSAMLWNTADRGSWVVPQLVAAISMIDESFRESAIERLQDGCPMRTDEIDQLDDRLLLHSARGPGGAKHRSAKMASALLGLLRDAGPNNPALEAFDRDVALQELIAVDIDRGGDIATAWRTEFRALLRQRARP